MTQRAARAIRDHARTQAERMQRVFRAEITGLDPLVVVRLDNEQRLEIEDDFDLSGWLKAYDGKFTLAVGETVLLHKEGGHYIAFDVVTDKDLVL